MDKLLYEAESFLISYKMGASEETNKVIKDYSNKLIKENIIEYNENINYTKQDVSNYDLKLKKAGEDLKKSMDAVLSYDKEYNLTNFLYKLHTYKNLKSEKEKAEKVVKENEGVKNFFGNFSETKKVVKGKNKIEVQKTSDELIAERNSRLAMLNQMHADGEITDEELKRNVIYLRRVYQRSIENQVVIETQKEAELCKSNTLTNKIKNKLNSIISKISNVFKFNIKTKNKIETNITEETEIINRNACQALGKTADIIIKTEDINRAEVVQEVSELDNVNIEIIKNSDFSNKISLVEIASEIYKHKILNANDEETKEFYKNKVFNFGLPLVAKNNGEILPNQNIKQEKEKFIEYMYKKHSTKFDVVGGVPVEKFEDEKIQKMYDDIIKQFDKDLLRVNELSKHENVVKDMLEQHKSDLNI